MYEYRMSAYLKIHCFYCGEPNIKYYINMSDLLEKQNSSFCFLAVYYNPCQQGLIWHTMVHNYHITGLRFSLALIAIIIVIKNISLPLVAITCALPFVLSLLCLK